MGCQCGAWTQGGNWAYLIELEPSQTSISLGELMSICTGPVPKKAAPCAGTASALAITTPRGAEGGEGTGLVCIPAQRQPALEYAANEVVVQTATSHTFGISGHRARSAPGA